VLVVDDDPDVRDSLVRALRYAGYGVTAAADGAEALALLSRSPADLIVLDVLMPMVDGLETCRRLRVRGDATPILVLTARGTVEDRVNGLAAGADDYLVKPFGLAELQARIRAVLRRVRPDSEVTRHGPLTVDMRTRKVTVSGQEVALTPKEFDILECLAADPGRVVSRQEILESAWDAHWYGPSKVLDVHVAALRRKLGLPGLIETVYGRGFRLGEL